MNIFNLDMMCFPSWQIIRFDRVHFWAFLHIWTYPIFSGCSRSSLL